MVIELLHIFAILCTTFVCGKLIAKIKLPAILGWLIAGIVFGPFLAGIVSLEITNSLWYNVFIKFFECFAGVMIGREVIFKKIASSGKQIIGITFVQFGGIALATAPVCGLLVDNYVFHAFRLNYLLIGMAFSATIANLIPEQKLAEMLKLYDPVLNLSLILVIVNLGMPLDYRLIAGAGLFTVIYIFSRGIGKIGVSLVFTGIAVSTLTVVDASLAPIVSGTIVAAAIINEIIAVIVAKFAFQWAGEIEE